MKYVIVGGAGAMGRITVRDLYETTDKAEIIIADYNLEKAEELAKSFKSKRVKAVKIDVSKRDEAIKALKGADIIINSTQYQYNIEVMKTALALKCHYLDLGGLFHTTIKQLELNEEFKKAGRIALLGIGSAPGITNIMSAHGANQLDSVSEIHIKLGAVDKTKYKKRQALEISYSLKTILEEFSFKPAVFKNGKIKFVQPMSGADAYRFPSPVGVQYPMYTIHSEIVTLPETYKSKGIREVSFKIGFDKDFTEKVKFLRDFGLASEEPVEIMGTKVIPIDLVNRIAMSQPAPEAIGDAKQYAIVRSIVKGTKNNKKYTVFTDAHIQGLPEWDLGIDIDTGCPPSIAAQMILSGEIKGSGTLAPEVAVNPETFFKELEKRRIIIKSVIKNGWSFPA